jgi:hypothetical protein
MRRSLILLGVIVLCYAYSLLPPLTHLRPSAGDRDRWVSYLIQGLDEKGTAITEEEALAYVKQAHDVAASDFPRNKGKRVEFVDRALELFVETAGADVLIIHNSGGWGRTPYNLDRQWGPVEREIEAILAEQGYTSVISSFVRTQNTPIGIVEELQELLLCFPTKAKVQSEAVRFVTEARPNLRVLITGLSQGGAYTNEVLKQLGANDQVYGIAAGVPFYYCDVDTPKSLVLQNNGRETDALKDGDAPALLTSVIKALLKWCVHGLDGGPLGVGAYYAPPGHRYRWSYPGVAEPITGFIEGSFPNETVAA